MTNKAKNRLNDFDPVSALDADSIK